MKKNYKSAALLCLVAALLCIMFLFAACDKTDDANAVKYEVTVLAPDNAPAAGAKVSFLETEDGKTHTPVTVSVNALGVATYTAESGNPVDATLTDIPAEYEIPNGKETLRLTKNSPKATVTLQARDDSLPDLVYSEPLSGGGTAKYVNGSSGQLEYGSFNPYVVEEGNYKFAFESANKKIYLQFNSHNSKAALYLVYSRGSADVSVQMLTGSTIGGVFNPGEGGTDNDGRPQFNDNKSLTDKNFELEFSNNESSTMTYTSDGVFYFELALKNPADIGKRFAVTFEKSDKPYVAKPPTAYTDIHADPAPTKAADGEGTLRPIPTNCANFAVVKAADGSYRLGNAAGPILYANLDGPWPCGADLMNGQPMTCVMRISGGSNPYKWVKTVSDAGDTGENWLPFLLEYVGYVLDSDGTLVAPGASNSETGFVNRNSSKCNKDGYYPVNDQIVEFLKNVYRDGDVQGLYFIPNNLCNVNWFLPEGFEWLFLCGYYGDEYKGSDFGGSGTQDEPYTVLREGEFELDIPADGRLYFSAGLSYVVSSQTAGATLEYNGKTYGADGNGFSVTVTPDNKLFELYLQNGEAGKVTLSIVGADLGDGSVSDPYTLTELVGAYAEHVDAGESVWYSVIDLTGKFEFTAGMAGITFVIYDIDGWADIESGGEATPLVEFTSTSAQMSFDFELDGNNYFIAVSFASDADITWEISQAD